MIRFSLYKPQEWPEEEIRAIVAEYKSGDSTIAIARQHNTSFSTVRRLLLTAGGTIRPRGRVQCDHVRTFDADGRPETCRVCHRERTRRWREKKGKCSDPGTY